MPNLTFSLILTLALTASIASETARAETASCTNEAQIATLPEVDAGSADVTTLIANLKGYKSEASVGKYMQCYARVGGCPKLNPKGMSAAEKKKNLVPCDLLYEKKTRALVKSAAEATGIPFAILACLFFQESQWDRFSVSSSNAVGLAQLLSKTWDGMLTKINGAANVGNPYVASNLRMDIPKNGNTFDKQMKKIEDLYKSSYRNGALSGKANLVQLNSLLTSLKGVKSARFQKNLKLYLSNVRNALDRIEIQEAVASYSKKTGKKPNLSDRTNPESAVIVGATYLKTIVFKGIFGFDSSKATQDQWIIATGGYNTGPGNSPCDASMTANRCIEVTIARENKGSTTKVTHESSRHMRAIRNCSELGNKKPKPDGLQKDCAL
jgi:hypothetical protein